MPWAQAGAPGTSSYLTHRQAGRPVPVPTGDAVLPERFTPRAAHRLKGQAREAAPWGLTGSGAQVERRPAQPTSMQRPRFPSPSPSTLTSLESTWPHGGQPQRGHATAWARPCSTRPRL